MYERSSVVEHVLHTDGVVGSIPIVRTSFHPPRQTSDMRFAAPAMRLSRQSRTRFGEVDESSF